MEHQPLIMPFATTGTSCLAGVRAYAMAQASGNAASENASGGAQAHGWRAVGIEGAPAVGSVGVGPWACGVLSAVSPVAALPAIDGLGGLLVFTGLDSDEDTNSTIVLARQAACAGALLHKWAGAIGTAGVDSRGTLDR